MKKTDITKYSKDNKIMQHRSSPQTTATPTSFAGGNDHGDDHHENVTEEFSIQPMDESIHNGSHHYSSVSSGEQSDDDDGKDNGADSDDDDISRQSREGSSDNQSSFYSSTKNNHYLFARRESEQICWLRGLVMVVLLLATFMVSVVIFFSTRRSEIDQFETQFGDVSQKIMDSFQARFDESLSSIDQLAVSVTASGKEQNWPYCIVPEFPIRAASVLHMTSNANFLSIHPLVTEVGLNRREWEVYSVNSAHIWINDAANFQNLYYPSSANDNNETDNDNKDNIYAHLDDVNGNTIATSICKLGDDVKLVAQPEQPGQVYFPLWQHSPNVTSQLINFDILSHPTYGREAQVAYDSKSVVIGKVNDYFGSATTYLLHQTSKTSSPSSNSTLFNDEQNDATDDPVSNIYFPIFDDFELQGTNTEESSSSSSGTANAGTRDPELVALMMITVEWTNYFQGNPLPESANGIRIVLANACDQSYTYEVTNNRVVFVREGDHHDPEYNYMMETTQIINDDGSFPFFSHRGLHVNTTFCSYSLHVFPSRNTKLPYFTAHPILYTVLVIVVFLFTSAVFVTYDLMVERRQHLVMKTAVKSHQIVSSLFPAVVRNRLFGDDGGMSLEEGSHTEHHRPQTGKMRITNFINEQEDGATAPDTKANSNLTPSTDPVTASPSSTRQSIRIDMFASKPIADFFPNTTVLFADISGFTAWSSVREPAQVFVLLETIYAGFDKVAARRKVFKVETIGDCYVAVTGLPAPQENHATIMARFASECQSKMKELTKALSTELGPDTAELTLRIGLHSGPVTAGVLRGQKSRFQLFGDTVNTASRMESTGKPTMIQCSQVTADLLIEAGKSNWVKVREDLVQAKGIGEVQTYWVFARSTCGSTASTRASEHSSNHESYEKLKFNGFNSGGDGSRKGDDDGQLDKSGRGRLPRPRYDDGHGYEHSEGTDADAGAAPPRPSSILTFRKNNKKVSDKLQRLIDWNNDLLSRQLKLIIARRKRSAKFGFIADFIKRGGNGHNKAGRHPDVAAGAVGIKNPREEYSEVISLPRFDASVVNGTDPESFELDEPVTAQLRDYITQIATSYNDDNPFHNFDHATHVTMSANKLLKRIVAADDCHMENAEDINKIFAHLHDFTYGITSDPLTHFACIFSAMIHDVDHPGVSNRQLIVENDEMAAAYDNKSVAEQNSVDLAWELLMDSAYTQLRQCLFQSDEDKRRFRKLLVNSVMATDIFDPDLKALRNNRWDKAFHRPIGGKTTSLSSSASTTSSCPPSPKPGSSVSEEDKKKKRKHNSNNSDKDSQVSDLKATIVIEHIIQAADVAHTMQHWHVYQKWNRRLFEEMYMAYKAGRAPTDPSVGWYQGELWFYDNYIIPLANKLRECKCFGSASDEFLNYAQHNRREWAAKGEGIVTEMVSTLG